MNKAVYDTRFFDTLYNSRNEALKKKIQTEKNRNEKYVSTVVIHELYKLTLANEGREIAKLKIEYVKRDFELIPVDDQIAQVSAEFRHKYDLPMGDSMIAATAFVLKAVCISDDPHFQQIKEIKTQWL
ncbi:MAG: PIN domain-containing protein [Candidatus Bathyarchaeota archaeon]|nr:PIN domain-containing protein [Candidatus Bathyarchaeota archaeon]